MKVCTLTHTYPRFPGDINAPFVETLTEHIAACGHDISVLTAHDPAWNRGAGDHTVDLRTYRYIWPERLHILGYSRTIEGNVRFRPHVMFLSPFLFHFAERAFDRLVREKQPDVLHAHWILPNGYIAARVAARRNIPLVVQLHGSDVFTAEKNRLFSAMARYAAGHARCIVSPSPDLTERLGALGADRGKVRLVPNTVEADFADGVDEAMCRRLRRSLEIPENHTVVLAMGRMVHVKGFDHLLRAFASIAGERGDVTLVLAGGGVLYSEMIALADSLGISGRVRFPGPVLRDMVPVYFRMADLFVIPSVKHPSGAVDGLPVVVPEAMAAGLPIVASEVGGIPVLVRDGWNGVLVGQGDADAIARAVGALLDDPARRTEYGARSREMVKTRVNYDAVAAYFSRLYDAVAKGENAGEFG